MRAIRYLPGKRRRPRRRALDRSHRLRDPRAAPRRHEEEATLGLPHYDQATERQRRDGMCWRESDELYNEGSALQSLRCRDHRGVMVTIIADNYYGYCKKEVKTQISYAANLFGLVRGRARRRRNRLRHIRARPGFLRRPHREPEKSHLRGRDASARPARRAPARRLRDRSPLSRRSTTCRKIRRFWCAKGSSAGSTTARRISSPSVRPRPMFCRLASAFDWKSSWPAMPGASSARARKARCATNLPPFRAAANPKSRNRSRTPC